MSIHLTESERQALCEAFDDNPDASGDWVITQKEWKQLYAAVESIVESRNERLRAGWEKINELVVKHGSHMHRWIDDSCLIDVEHIAPLIPDEVNQFSRVCTTPGCTGDGRYAAPGRGHQRDCHYPRPEGWNNV